MLQRVVIAVPFPEKPFFETFLKGYDPWVQVSAVMETVSGDSDAKDPLNQVRYDVLTADQHVRDDVDFIMHFDSDAMLTRHLLWTDLFKDGKAVGQMSKWEHLPQHIKQTQYADVKVRTMVRARGVRIDTLPGARTFRASETTRHAPPVVTHVQCHCGEDVAPTKRKQLLRSPAAPTWSTTSRDTLAWYFRGGRIS